ncbi:uncharacterized protein N7500_007319 [Penicillium coprophilum]|uniref:uncharacterized protein n=1 Tax=Penicillium coprophilum TaxID=36646 RepID=UPI002395B4B9|nr:uncharacterized protein N7500_007319 [Penicillium coprophilum]KAJ5165489.1 hypothetical protein N7500_007319 [Penicillium coprophilum]
MSTNLFCCTTLQTTTLPDPEHEQTFTEFTKWALTTINNLKGSTDPSEASVCIQLVRQVINGPIESIRYFIASDKHGNFEEVTEDDILATNFIKMNECKSFQCRQHNWAFDLNLYEPSTGSTRHWRSIAKPLKQIENALKNKMSGSGSGSQSVSGSRSSLRSMMGYHGSGGGYRGASYGYGSGMGYGSGWGSHLGAGCGPNWGTGSTVLVPEEITTVVTGCQDSDCGLNRNQDQSPKQDYKQEQDQDQDRYPGISLPADETEFDESSEQDQPGPSSSIFSNEVTEDEDTGSYSALLDSQLSSSEVGASQSYLDVEDYGCYYSGASSDDYGIYDCGGGANAVSYECGDYEDFGGCGGCEYE